MGLSWLRQRDLVLVLVLVVVTSSAIELTGGNICPRVENYTATFKESYVEPVVVNTFAWCLQVPPRCPRSRVEMRERWRIKTETRQRKVIECCEGYVIKATKDEGTIREDFIIGKCEPQCEICEYGTCVAPNTCVCGPGHRGEGCAYECPAGTWGDRCSKTCNCESAEICNPVDGKCHCPPGWQGSGCKEECPVGMWGIDCALSCVCNNDNSSLRSSSIKSPSACHHETGICINFEETIVSPTAELSNWFEAKETTGTVVINATTDFIPLPSTKLLLTDSTNNPSSKVDCETTDVDSVGDDDDDVFKHDRVANEPRLFATKPSRTTEPSGINDWNELDYQPSEASSTKPIEIGLSETSVDPLVSQIDTTGTSSIATGTVTNNYGNYNGNQRVERIDAKVPRVKKPSTSRPIVAVVHVSGNGSPGHDGPMIMTSMNSEKVPTHVVPMPLDVVALIVVGSIISLGLTTLAVIAVLHIRSRLFETIRLSIYDAEKRESTNGTINRGGGEKGNTTRISSMGCNSSVLSCEYETPRCIVPEHQTLPRPRPASNIDLIKKPESCYSNDYPNIRLFSNLQELLEAHYDRPPSTFRPAVLDIDGEHVYDEIPLQSSTTFTTKRDT